MQEAAKNSIEASGRNKHMKYLAPPKESDLGQVGLRRQICPQVCNLTFGMVEDELAVWHTDSPGISTSARLTSSTDVKISP